MYLVLIQEHGCSLSFEPKLMEASIEAGQVCRGLIFTEQSRAQQWVLKQMTGCEQKQGLLSLGSVGSGKHKHSNRKTRVAPKKINGAMHELKEYKSERSVKTLLSAVYDNPN